MHLSDMPDAAESMLCNAIVEQAAEAVIFADVDGMIRIWNHGAELVFGFSATEALSNSLDLIIPERFRRAHWAGFNKAIESGHTQYSDRVRTTRGVHKDGRKLYVDLSFGLITAPTGQVVGSLAIGRDSTDRYLAESALRVRVAALEAELTGLRGQPVA